MRYVKWSFLTLLVLLVAGFLHYTLPRHDVVRIVGTYQQRVDLDGWANIFWSGSSKTQQASQGTRDVQFIQAVRPDGKPVVYRNEDTGWGWPPYFKFDTATLQTRADDLKSTAETPKWVVVTRYGWRNQIWSIFPNALSVSPVSGPDVTVIPWATIVFFVVLIVIALFLRTLWKLFEARIIAPFVARWRPKD